jgi:1-acyl-sn-glycerol-3-phosphate acyltransferase
MFFIFIIIYNRFTYSGKRKVPFKNNSGIILASNHCSNLDPFYVGVPFHRKITFFAKKSLFKGIVGFWVKNVGALPVDREDVSPSALKDIFNALKARKTLVIFPEGTRSDTGEILPFRKGIGLIVKKSKAIVVPAYIKGSFKIFPKGSKIPKPYKCTTYYGSPVKLDDLINDETTDKNIIYERIAERIRESIVSLKNKKKSLIQIKQDTV